MNKKLFLVVLGSLLFVCQASLARQPLTFQERVKAQEAIERVYYNHRIWPRENPTPKPSFEQMVPRAMLEAKVTDYLKKSAALDEFWQRPITAEQLQAEMDRMAKGTKDPSTLKELFAAFNNNPTLIAECLARPILADRLIRDWYANDERLHGETRAKAEAVLASVGGGSLSLCNEGNYQKVIYVLSDSEKGAFQQETMKRGEIVLDTKRFEKQLAESPEEGNPAVLRETPEAFVLTRTALKTPTRIEIATLFFPKKDMEEWLKVYEPSGLFEEFPPGGFAYIVPPIPLDTCSGDTWTPVSTGTNCPSSRRNHTAIWTGMEMIIWGGIDDTYAYLNAGGRYTPSTDSWAPTSTGANCPLGRFEHTAVWTGVEMIVWGGAGGNNTGGRYNPYADTWVPTSVGTNCPLGRWAHTAIWSGSEMIVWGGYYTDGYSENYFSTGGRYNPTSDFWTPTSTATNCPLAREYHSAIWTGTEMIVWGGRDGTNHLNSGGRYNPFSDSWTPTSTGTNCPSIRDAHTAVWTGAGMIVWGGHNGTNYLNTGGRYNLSSNSWTPTSIGGNVPLGREYYTAIWTGTEMIVWGGELASAPYLANTGGRYKPLADAWNPTSAAANCPSGRDFHTAVWTGTEMIVFGGQGGGCLNTGGVYSTGVPCSVPATSLSWTGTGKDTLSWSAADCATSYRVYQGDSGQLQNLPTGASVCMAYDGNGSNATTTGSTLTSNPAASSFFWYLVVGYNANGEGSPGGGTNYPLRMLNYNGMSCP